MLSLMTRSLLPFLIAVPLLAQPQPVTFPGQVESDWVAHDFTFHTGETRQRPRPRNQSAVSSRDHPRRSGVTA